jgi:secondary thiamine-phosphate synthase enzyme
MGIIIKTLTLQTPVQGFIGITNQVQYFVNETINTLNIDPAKFEASVTVFCPHTTAAITVNENADPDVQQDFLLALDHAFPYTGEFKHDNSPAHLKSSLIGCSKTLLVHEGQLVLGRMQAVYFCEFDGPRTRTFYVQIQY